MKPVIPPEPIHQLIYLIRGQQVMLDADLAALYNVPTKRLNEQVRRNSKRFPLDFMFQMTAEETDSLRSQFATLKKMGRGRHRKYLPYVFTEHGVAMLSSVLNSERAIEVNMAIIRAFIEMRRTIATHRDLARRLAAQEQKMEGLTADVQKIFNLIQPLLDGPVKPIREIGFQPER